MKNLFKTVALGALAFAASFATPSTADAQEAILAEIYGRGVHAFYSGQHQQAHSLFSSAINGGSQDPRAYYFRGIVATMMGRSYEADSDWRQGATIEAARTSDPSIGRALSRYQGSGRLKLEMIRQQARLQALTSGITRSDARASTLRPSAPISKPAMGAPSGAVAVPPPAPPADENPFGDTTNMATGEAMIEKDDAMAGMSGDPFKDDAGGAMAAPAGDGGGGDPFGGGGGGAAADPFGGGGSDAGTDPFGGGGGADADPFGGGGDAGGDPFGGGGEAMADDPFAN